MTAQTIGDMQQDGATGRIFSYANARDVTLVDDLTREHPASGLVIRGRDAVPTIARLREPAKRGRWSSMSPRGQTRQRWQPH